MGVVVSRREVVVKMKREKEYYTRILEFGVYKPNVWREEVCINRCASFFLGLFQGTWSPFIVVDS